MKRNKRIEKNREFCLGWLFNMSWDFLSLSLSPICSHVPAGGLLEEKFISRMIKLACTPIFIPPFPLLSLFLSLLPLSACTLAHPMLCTPLSSRSALALPFALPPLYLAAVQWAFLSVTLISSRKGGKCENFPWRLLISVAGELRVAFGAFFSLFTEESFIINWQPSHKGIGLFLC